MIGQTLGHYRVLEQIGAGGMGVVYRAHDERLNRDVALKVLPAGALADGAARKRFRKEALTLSKLNHPNVETVFDFDTEGGMDFLAMELIPGITLDQKLVRGALPEEKVLRLGVQLAEGLVAAHAEGVVHRDLKPGNLRLTPDGRLKILDFGLAKLLLPMGETADTASLSETHGVTGTLPYMAPEQLRGEPADARSDLWAAGAVLYEMATGKRPFPQTSGPILTDAILHQTPPLPSAVRPGVLPGLEAIILKALDKDPEHRYQSAKELAVDLRRMSAPSASAVAPAGRPLRRWRLLLRAAIVIGLLSMLFLNTRTFDLLIERTTEPAPAGDKESGVGLFSVAVLPLVNSTGLAENEYLSDGITEGLINRLSRLDRLRVMARSTAFHYKGKNFDVRSAGREMNVGAVVTGRVQRRGDHLDVQVELVNTSDGSQLWGEQYTRKLSQLIRLQDEIAGDISGRLVSRLTGEERQRLARRETKVPEAYELYLQGRFHWNKRNPAAVRKGLDYFRRAAEKDPDFALAYSGLADSYMLLGSAMTGTEDPREMMPKAKESALAALERDETLAESHATLGYVKAFYDWTGGGRKSDSGGPWPSIRDTLPRINGIR